MAIIYILVIIAKSPWLLLCWLLKHRAVLVIGVIIVGVLVVINSYNSSRQPSEYEVPQYQISAPDKSTAPQIYSTPSRVYYVVASYESGDELVLTDFYDYDRKKWERHTQPLPLKKSEVKIYER